MKLLSLVASAASQSCGGSITGGSTVEIVTPGAPNQMYYHNENCVWNIAFDYSVTSYQIRPIWFGLESCSDCNCDTAEIVDRFGNVQNYCGKASRKRRESEKTIEIAVRRDNAITTGFPSSGITLPGRTGTISFITDGSVYVDGFRLEIVPQHCGGVIDTARTIESPNFGLGNYFDNLECVWNINFPSAAAIQIVSSSFQLESESTCGYDTVQIIDNQGIEQNFCGYSSRRRRDSDEQSEKNGLSARRANAVSSGFPSDGIALIGNTGTISFITDGSSVHPGFRLEISPLASIPCGGTIGEGDVIESPGFTSGSYFDNLNCVWNIELPSSAAAFQLIASTFELESESTCGYDTFQIIDNRGSEQNFCGYSSRRRRESDELLVKNRLNTRRENAFTNGFPSDGVTVFGNTGTISFITDGSSVHAGFRIEVIPLTSIPCGGVVGESDVIKSPGFDTGSYYDNLSCTWTVQLSESVPAFEILPVSFGLQNCSNCECDNLHIIDEEGSEYQFCGDDGMQTLGINGNTATIIFTSNGDTIDSGFELQLVPLDAPLSLSPTAAWQELDAAYSSLFQGIFNSYELMPNIPSIKKANRLRDFFQKISNFPSRTSDSCANYAGSGDPNDFIVPSYDEQDLCGSLNTFFMSAKSYHNAFVCMDGVDLTANNRWAAHKMTRLIQRQRHILFTRKLRRLNCF